jgi:hypothetical protein
LLAEQENAIEHARGLQSQNMKEACLNDREIGGTRDWIGTSVAIHTILID